MDVDLENGASDNLGVESRPSLLHGEPRLLPTDLLKDLKTHEELATLHKEASVHLMDLKSFTAMSEVNESEILELQMKIKAKENEILKEALEVKMETRELSEGEYNENHIMLDREITEMEIASSTLGKVAAKGKFLFSSFIQTKNLEVGKIVANASKCGSALVTGEVPMEIAEECPPSGSTVGMFSPEGKLVVPQISENIKSVESKLLEEEKIATKQMEVALEEQVRFTTKHLNDLRKVQIKLIGTVAKVTAAYVDLLKKCEDPDLIDLLEENLLFIDIQLEVVNEVMNYAKIVGKIDTKRIELNYQRHLFEPRLKLSNEIKLLTEKRQSCRGNRWTEETGPDFHQGKLAGSSADCLFSVDNPAGLDPF